MHYYILLAIAICLLGYLGYGDFVEARQTQNKKAMQYQLRSVYIIAGALVLSVILYLTYPLYKSQLGVFRVGNVKSILFIVFSFAISYLWFLFFRALDIFEKEKTGILILVFIMACVSTFLVFPLAHFIRGLGLTLDGSLLNDYLFCFLGIGVPEELVKIFPLLIILTFSKHIDEPYDFILYGGVCALGFAFIENIQYLSKTGMTALGGRALYSTVSHIFDTSIICYFMAIARYKGTNIIWAFIKGFLLAALAHGFYDFWLISETYSFSFATIVFFLLSIHFLTMMINNLLNISPYYQPERRLRTAKYKFYLTTYLIVLSAAGFVFILFNAGEVRAVGFAYDTAIYQSYTLAYLVISFTSLNVVHGYLMPLDRPKNVLFPLVNRYPNFLVIRAELDSLGRSSARAIEQFKQALPMEVVLSKRVVVEGNFNWYYLTGTTFPDVWKDLGHQVIAQPVKFENHLKDGNWHAYRLAIIKNEDALGRVELNADDLRPLGNGRLKVLSEPL